ncbi:MAG: polysaccharide biosynthesis/export family protein [Muribaculaceae bacterium]|nr:polysaccharide biosynthesis/export family protein [Muribaculaceae bacterium]
MKHYIYLIVAIVCMTLAACSTSKDVTYMTNADQIPQDVLARASHNADPTLMPGDLLYINVSSTNLEAVKPFNKTEYIASTGTGTLNNQENSMYYYLVDNNGNIDFPLLGKLHVSGMTKSATENYIASQIYPRYLTEKPGVEVRLQNFSVFVTGEVKTPGEIKAPNGRINLLEALAKAGDLTIQGRRDNVMIIHTNADGSRSIKRANLNDAQFILQPEFNLQQNDIIYVEPNASRARASWSIPPALTLTMSSIGTLISIVTLIVTLTK